MDKKKILLVPMSAMAETAGPGRRCRILAEGFRKAGMEVHICIARDVNYFEIDGITDHKLSVPTPMGMPRFLADRFFPVVQALRITSRKTVGSFDQVLFFTGNLDEQYLRRSVEDIRTAIRACEPDILYSEFNISAIIAAKLEGVRLFTTVSYPTQESYACEPKLAKALNRVLRDVGLAEVSSALEPFTWAEERFCPSIPELEPFDDEVTYIGAIRGRPGGTEGERDKILVYPGNGTVSAARMLREVSATFRETPYQVYIASKYLKPQEAQNIHVAAHWDFEELLREAALFIHHGGQNSMVDGLLHGVAQIVVPGKVFERRYNAASLERTGAGRMLSHTEFCTEKLRRLAEELIGDDDTRVKAKALGEKLLQQGGVDRILSRM